MGRIGEGTYGVVLRAKHRASGELVAVKRFKEASDDSNQVREESGGYAYRGVEAGPRAGSRARGGANGAIEWRRRVVEETEGADAASPPPYACTR